MTLEHVEEASQGQRPSNAMQRPFCLGGSEIGTQAAALNGAHTRLSTWHLLDEEKGHHNGGDEKGVPGYGQLFS